MFQQRKLDPLMWTSYEALCELGATDIDPTSVFGVRPVEIDKLQERIMQQKSNEAMPLQEKVVLTTHQFSSPPPTSAKAVTGITNSTIGGRSMDLVTPLSTGSLDPKVSLRQTAQGSLPRTTGKGMSHTSHQFQFDTPNLTPIPMQHDASFVHHHNYPPSAITTATDGTNVAETGITVDFVDSINPNIIRRAKNVAARMYYQPSPETPHYFAGQSMSSSTSNYGPRYPYHRGNGTNVTGALTSGMHGETSARRFLRGKSALWSGASISDTPLRRGGGRPSDISTTRRPRALFLSENKPMRENTNDINHNMNIMADDDHLLVEDDENFDHRRLGQEGEENTVVVEGLEDLEPPDNVMTSGGGEMHAGPSSYFDEDEKPLIPPGHNAHDQDAVLAVEEGCVQQILELLCLLGAGYWRLCQVRSDSFFGVNAFQVVLSHVLSFLRPCSTGVVRPCSSSEPSPMLSTTLDGFFTKRGEPTLKWQTTRILNVAWSLCRESNLIA